MFLYVWQAGGMDRAAKMNKLRDEERERGLGYVHGVSGPGKFNFIYLFVVIIHCSK